MGERAARATRVHETRAMEVHGDQEMAVEVLRARVERATRERWESPASTA
jgi:hypothetical protein